jgi:hypothetical protein
MGGDKRFGIGRRGTSHGFILAFACLAVVAGGCSKAEPEKAEKAEKTEKADSAAFDASRLPRVSGAKQIFASPATTIFTSPDSVAQTAETLDKALAAAGWQEYVAPHATRASDPKMRIMTLKRGAHALNVFITVAPAQNNATSVQYSELPLKTDLPFTRDASHVEYSPDRPLLTLLTGEPVDKTLDFYRKELGARGWALWSEKLNGKQPDGGPSGVVHERGGYAHYVNDKEPKVTLVVTLQNVEAGKYKVELKEWPVGILASLHKAYLNGGPNSAAPLVDVGKLPRLEGAAEKADRTSKDRVVYSVPGTVANTTAALMKRLGAEGWKPYVAPLEEPHWTRLTFKKGGQGLSVSFTIQVGKNERTSEVTTVDYSPTRLPFALPFPSDATDIVFDENRPYLNCVTSGTVEATLDYFRKELTAAGYSPLSTTDAAAKWPNAKLDDKIANGTIAYFMSENQRPMMLSLQRRDDGKTSAEIKVPPFALAQTLEADSDVFGLPRPKRVKTSGGTGGATMHEAHAHVIAEVDTVLAFYRRELAARHWKEETEGAVVTPQAVTLNFTAPEGPAVLKIGHKYDLTVVSLVLHMPKPAAKAQPATADSLDSMMKDMQHMVREATAAAQAGTKSPAAQAPKAPEPALRVAAENKAPVPMPDNAEDVEFDGADGKLEFSSEASVNAVAEFYRSTMKQQGWASRSSVINNANMVVLNFAKAGKAVSFTIMKMGNKTNVAADGSGLQAAAAKPAAPSAKAEPAQAPASADDLVAEESGGLPLPKRHTMSEGTKTPFRRELKASVPLALTDVLGFYRRELGKVAWKEQIKGTVIAADNVVVAYTSPDGPAFLKLGRKDGATTVNLVVKNPDAAVKAGMMPKPGQAKLAFVNPNDVEASVTINKQTVKVVAGGGTKGPDGKLLDLPAGKYKFSIKLAGKPAVNDELEVGADEAWGLLISPAGALPMQVY